MPAVADCDGLQPEHVWHEHVARRTPYLFSSLPSDIACLQQLVSLESLQDLDNASLKVETRAETGRAFGNGRKRSMKVNSFVRELSKGNTDLYLTTQEAPEDSDGFPALLTVPLKHLVANGLPVKPEVMGNLVPQAVNLWMGCSQDGSSSGLHHDFHDNLYVLLCGRKRFRLYPPSKAGSMYTHGQVSKIHKNGRIVYKGEGTVHADGSDEADLRRWRLKQRADSALQAAKSSSTPTEERSRGHGIGPSGASTKLDKQSKSTGPASQDHVRQGEERAQQSGGVEEASDVSREGSDIEDALEAALDAAACGDVGFSSEEEWASSSDDEAARACDAGSGSEDGGLARDEDGRSADESAEGAVIRARGSGGACGGDGAKRKVRRMAKTTAPSASADASKIPEGHQDDVTVPDSFSQVDLTLPEEEIKRRFPLFPGVGEALEVTVEAGQALYLPASWFHEVTSFGSGDSCMHVAVNYWFHPPDRLAGSDAADQGVGQAMPGASSLKHEADENVAAGQFGKQKAGVVHRADVDLDRISGLGHFPYKTDFWPSMWNARVDRHSWPQHLKVPLSGCQ